MTPAPEPPALAVVDLGICGYHEAWEQQLALVEARKAPVSMEAGAPAPDGGPGCGGVDTLLLVEHPHVITVGRSQKALANVVAADGVEVVSVERGGDVTYHGPGQLVAYPIIQLREGERDLHRYLRNLEEAVITTCAAFGLDAGREPGKTGVWLDGTSGSRKKLCSIGVACRRWVTFHGLALNVSTDLSYFFRINPCGFESSVMTSMTAELGAGLSLLDVKHQLARSLATTLARRLL